LENLILKAQFMPGNPSWDYAIPAATKEKRLKAESTLKLILPAIIGYVMDR
jgi:hypothetical protein